MVPILSNIGDDKYLRIMEETIMDTIDDQNDVGVDHDTETQRDIIRQLLNEIANDAGMALRDVGLRFPVFLTMRDHGGSLATIATPVDRSDDKWERASSIVCEIIEKKMAGAELLCVVETPSRGVRPRSRPPEPARIDAITQRRSSLAGRRLR